MNCCEYQNAAAERFGTKHARKDVSRYHRKGPDGTTQALVDLLRDTGISQASLLDIGAGIGVLHHELMTRIVARVSHVEASPSYLTEARREAEQRSHAENVRFIEGDATELGDALPDADIVTLDRVICCYPDWDGLLTHSAPNARRYYGFSIPRYRWVVRLLVAFQNLHRRLRGSAFRTFVHSPEAIDRRLGELGFRRGETRNSFVWHTALYIREE